MHLLLHPVGSAGDVHPTIPVGRLALREGHAVTLLTSEPFRGLAARHGFGFAPTATAEEYAQVIGHPDVWHPTKSLRVLFGTPTSRSMLRRAYGEIAARVDPANPRRTVVLAGSLGLAARIAQDALGVPVATLHLQPASLPSVMRPPHFGTVRVPDWLPRWAVRALYAYGERMLDGFVAPPVNELRAELGLAPVRRAFGAWRHSPECVVNAFPAWYADAPDWPPVASHAGFVRYDRAGEVEPPPELVAFLDAGEAPVAVTFGTAMRQGLIAFTAARDALQLAGKRGLFLAKSGAQIPPLPPTIFHAEYAPLGEVLPRCAALVHHGGIGTSAQALAAGLPQLIRPMAFDQPDNAERLTKLGVAESLVPKRFTPQRVAAALARLTTSPRVRAAGAALAGRMATDADGAAAAWGRVRELGDGGGGS